MKAFPTQASLRTGRARRRYLLVESFGFGPDGAGSSCVLDPPRCETPARRGLLPQVVHARVSEEMPASCEAVFDLVHDYERRLEWDTLLRAAFVEGGGAASRGAVAVCSGRWLVGGLTLRTVYVSFARGDVAAVKMVNCPPLFERWAASIRHEPLSEHRSRIVYTYNFRARPRFLAFLLEPILAIVFRWETRRRLRALRAALVQRSQRAS